MYQIAQQLSQQVIVCVSLSSFSRLTCPSFSSAQLDQPMALLSRMAAAAAANRAVGTMLGAIVQGDPPYSRRRPPNGRPSRAVHLPPGVTSSTSQLQRQVLVEEGWKGTAVAEPRPP